MSPITLPLDRLPTSAKAPKTCLVLAPLGGNAAFRCNAAADTSRQSRIANGVYPLIPGVWKKYIEIKTINHWIYIALSDLAEENKCSEGSVFNNEKKKSPSAPSLLKPGHPHNFGSSPEWLVMAMDKILHHLGLIIKA